MTARSTSRRTFLRAGLAVGGATQLTVAGCVPQDTGVAFAGKWRCSVDAQWRLPLHDNDTIVPAAATAGIFVAGASRQLIHAHTSGARPRCQLDRLRPVGLLKKRARRQPRGRLQDALIVETVEKCSYRLFFVMAGFLPPAESVSVATRRLSGARGRLGRGRGRR